jgi:glycosyltransferase involved in cell wall biosynthesis
VGYRILYHHRTQALDGMRVHITAIQEALRGLGHDVTEVSPLPAIEKAGSASVPTFKRRVLQTVAQHTPRGLYDGLALAYNIEGYRALARAIEDTKPHFIYERYAMNTVAGVWASKRFRIPLLLEVNSPLADENRDLGQALFHTLSTRLERYTLSNAARVLAVTEVLGNRLTKSAALAPERVVVVHNGADPDTLRQVDCLRPGARQALHYTPGEVVLGAVGFFREWHGIDLLLTAVANIRASVPSARILLVGDGPAIPQLKTLAERLGLDDIVVFAGSVPHDRVVEHLAAMDAVIIPRAVSYASPLKLFEYMGAGKPVIAPRQANLLEIITDAHDALCFAAEDDAQLKQAILRIVREPDLRARLGAAARHTISERRLTWSGNAERIVSTFERLRAESVGAPAHA